MNPGENCGTPCAHIAICSKPTCGFAMGAQGVGWFEFPVPQKMLSPPKGLLLWFESPMCWKVAEAVRFKGRKLPFVQGDEGFDSEYRAAPCPVSLWRLGLQGSAFGLSMLPTLGRSLTVPSKGLTRVIKVSDQVF